MSFRHTKKRTYRLQVKKKGEIWKKIAPGIILVILLLVSFTGFGNDAAISTISEVTVSEITATGATIAWTNSMATISQIEYGKTDSYGSTTLKDDNLVTTHNITLTQLTAGTNYHFRVKSKDTLGNQYISGDYTFTTLPLSTTALLGQPDGLVNYGTADITVIGSDVVAYKYKLDDGDWGDETPVSTPITLSGLADGLHTISVIGKDAAGNWQAEDSSTTSSWTVDTTPPTAALSGQPDSRVNYGTADITIAGSDLEAYKYRLDDSDWGNETPVSTPITLSGLADGLHTISVIGKDAAGNWQAEDLSTTVSWTVDSTLVIFPDPNLEAAIREEIGILEGDIHQSDLAELTEFVAFDRSIADLTGLEQCASLTLLGLDTNEISDISPLSSLTSLNWLSIGENQVSDISPLSSLTSLTSLILDDNQISDIEPLVNNPWLGEGDRVYIEANPLSETSTDIYIQMLEDRGVEVFY
ncbi:leucine-rich repeat domain-containing protein [Chloroflexota bacterium]